MRNRLYDNADKRLALLLVPATRLWKNWYERAATMRNVKRWRRRETSCYDVQSAATWRRRGYSQSQSDAATDGEQ